MSNELRYKPALDGLRGVAILAVIIFHAYPQLLPGGWAGVDVFFVLSGYLITRLLLNEVSLTGRVSLGKFYLRRMLRLMPALWCLLLFMLVVILATHHRDALVKAWLVTATYLMNWNRAFSFWPEAYLGHTWSLAAEEQFYALWPLVFLSIRKRRPLAWIALAILATVVWRIYLQLHGAPFQRTYNGFDTHADPILIGCGLALLNVARLKQLLSSVWYIWPVLLVVIFLSAHFAESGVVSIGTTIVAVISAILIVVSDNEPINRILSSRFLVFTGKISYALYLWHFPLLELARQRLSEMRPIVVLALSYLIATASYFTVERFFRKMKSRFAATDARTTLKHSVV